MSDKISYTAIEELGKKNMTKYKLDRPHPTNAEMKVFTTQFVWEKDEKGKKIKCEKSCSELEAHAVNFIRNRCVNLRFKKDEQHMNLEDLDGKSLKHGQIPYNVEMDIDRRCLEVAVHRFMESGIAKDAFDIYYIYLEMFIGEYGKTSKMIDMLSEFESNASSLLMKHRDHYSHSVYVFLIGLAYYDSSENFRAEYRKKYDEFLPQGNPKEIDSDLAAQFLKYWGLTSLFHDIGYPFELSFEQVKSYFGDTIKHVPFVMYDMNNYINSKADDIIPELTKKIEKSSVELMEGFLSKEDEYSRKEKLKRDKTQLNELVKKKKDAIEKFSRMLPAKYKNLVDGNVNSYLSMSLEYYLGDNYSDSEAYKSFYEKQEYKKSVTYGDYLFSILTERNNPKKCNGYIDHAYFSAVMLSTTLINLLDADSLNIMYTNAITAIALHNSLYKFCVTNYKSSYNDGHHFTVQQNPLAYLLMLCDELQCWDRTSYGRNSRGQIHPLNCYLHFNESLIEAQYVFDAKYAEKKKDGNYAIKEEYKKVDGTYNKITNKNEFLTDIENIISINGDNSFNNGGSKTNLTVSAIFEPDKRYRRTYLSNSNFIHLYQFAYMVHQMNHPEISIKEMEKTFCDMSLEYQMSHIGRAKKYARYLNEIGCFYSDKPSDFELVRRIDENENDLKGELDTIGALEHDRWCFEHYAMGWIKGNDYELTENPSTAREQMRIHKDMIDVIKEYKKEAAINHYLKNLNDADREKDKKSINNLLNLLDREDNIKVYRI